MMQISYITLETLSPVVLMAPGSSQLLTASSSAFSGTLLRGALAGKYIADHKLGQGAHEDKGFIDYFFSRLRFIDANPLVQGKRAAVLPLSLMKAKAADAKEPILDLLAEPAQPGYKSLKGLAAIDGGTIRQASVHSSMNFHMSRSAEAERLSGHSQDGKVYTYESIDAGQSFQGAIIGDDECLQAFFDDVGNKGKSFSLRVGRSKNTEYGQCRFTLTPPQPLPEEALSQKVYLLLDTPLIPEDGLAPRAQDVLQNEVVDVLNARMGSSTFHLGAVFAAQISIDNFVGVWKMRRPRVTALAAGSIFEITKDGPWSDADRDALHQLMYGGAGSRQEEGFGQLRLWQPQKMTLAAAASAAVRKIPVTSPEVRRRAGLILKKVLCEQLRNFAYEDALELKGLDGSAKTHTFARLEGWLKGDFQQNFRERLSDSGPMNTALHTLKIHGDTLYDIFKGTKKAPYQRKERQEQLKKLIPEPLVREVGFIFSEQEYFHEYWRWFFRHGRKRTVQVRKENGGEGR